MSISPFNARPASAQSERRRTRLALAIATVGIAATLLAYAISPGVRHVVSHAAHSVSHALDRDQGQHKHAPAKTSAQPSHHAAAAGAAAAHGARSSSTKPTSTGGAGSG